MIAGCTKEEGVIFMKIKELKLWKKLLLILAIIILICIIALIFYKLSIYVDMERRFKEFESKKQTNR